MNKAIQIIELALQILSSTRQQRRFPPSGKVAGPASRARILGQDRRSAYHFRLIIGRTIKMPHLPISTGAIHA